MARFTQSTRSLSFAGKFWLTYGSAIVSVLVWIAGH